jgi:hypothetical protein
VIRRMATGDSVAIKNIRSVINLGGKRRFSQAGQVISHHENTRGKSDKNFYHLKKNDFISQNVLCKHLIYKKNILVICLI